MRALRSKHRMERTMHCEYDIDLSDREFSLVNSLIDVMATAIDDATGEGANESAERIHATLIALNKIRDYIMRIHDLLHEKDARIATLLGRIKNLDTRCDSLECIIKGTGENATA